MRIGMFPHLFLRLVVGSFMSVHSFFTLWSYEAYVKDLSKYIFDSNIYGKEFLIMVSSLIPFLEFAIGLMLVVGVFYKRALVICALLLLTHMVSNFSQRSLLDVLFITTTFVMTLFLILSAFTIKNKKDDYFTYK